MPNGQVKNDLPARLPARVFSRLIEDIPAAGWAEILERNPNVRRDVLEGFSSRPKKLEYALRLPVVKARLTRHLETDSGFLDDALQVWGEEAAAPAYLGMLDSEFVAERWRQVRDLLGPERFCLGLLYIDAIDTPPFSEILEREDFWQDRHEEGVPELFSVSLAAWGQFIRENPETAALLRSELRLDQAPDKLAGAPDGGREKESAALGHEAEQADRPRKFEKKLEKVQGELARVSGQLADLKSENDELRRKLKESETDFEARLRDSAERLKNEWFARYVELDPKFLTGEAARLDSLLQRTRRAFELQARADEEYGSVSAIRAAMLEIDLSLAGIESVYANSLVVHKEVEKVKEALLDEKRRLLRLPGIRKVTGSERMGAEAEMARGINLMDPVPANLPKLNKLRDAIQLLSDAGVMDDPSELEEAVRQKRKQVMEGLYSRFDRGSAAPERAKFSRDLDEFVGAGGSRKYVLFADGYNVLLRVHGDNEDLARRGLTELREKFVEAVIRKSARFMKVFLVFDGVENSRDVRGNTEIIYTDKRVRSADAVIIEKVSARKDQVLLVTADEEIISATQNQTFALIDPIDFYLFAFA